MTCSVSKKLAKLFNEICIKLKSQRGSVTVEFAICLPIIISLLCICLCFISASIKQNKCVQAAYQIARLSIIKDSDNTSNLSMQEIADNIVGSATLVKTQSIAETVQITVSTTFSPLNLPISGEAIGYLTDE